MGVRFGVYLMGAADPILGVIYRRVAGATGVRRGDAGPPFRSSGPRR